MCGNLTRELDHPAVREALAKLLDSGKARDVLFEQLDRTLNDAAAALNGLAGDTSDGDIGTAESKLGEVERLLEQLDRSKGDDRGAAARVTAERPLVVAGRAALAQLRVLKAAQFAADRAPEKCQDAKTRLQDLIRGYVDKKDASAVQKIALQARGIAEPIKVGLTRTDEQHPNMERAYSDANRFDASEGRWREVSAQHRSAAAAMWEHWKRARDAAHAACDDLAKGDQSSIAIAGMEEIRRGAASTIDVYKRDVDQWNADAVSLFQLDCTELDAIWLAMCGADEERNEWPDREEARATARTIADRMRTRVDPMLVRHADLKRRGDDLLREDETKERAAAILRTMDEQHAKFARIQAGGALRGADHPLSQYAAEHGKQMHDEYASRYSCAVYDQTYPDAGGRPDCVVIDSTCYVYEFKPETPAAKAKGEEQLKRYVPAVRNYYADRIAKKLGDDSSLQGKVTTAVETRCVKGGEVDFRGKVIPYPLCEKRFECTR